MRSARPGQILAGPLTGGRGGDASHSNREGPSTKCRETRGGISNGRTGQGRHPFTGGPYPSDALKLWDVDDWQEVLTLNVEEGQGSLFLSNAFSSDGNTVGTMSLNGFLHLWHAPSWEEINATEAREKAGSAQP